MGFDPSDYAQVECNNCLTARDITRHADLWAATYLCTDNRALVAHLLDVAADLMQASQTLMRLFRYDGYDPSRDPQQGLTEADRLTVLALASTCAYNAALFVQEAQRRRVHRASSGWDPITHPFAA